LYSSGVHPRAHELAISTIANKILVSAARASSSQARTALEATVVPTIAARVSSSSRTSSSSSSQARTASYRSRRTRSGRIKYIHPPTTAGVSAAPATAVDRSSICCISGCSCTDGIVFSSGDKKYRCSFHHFQRIPADK